MKTRLYQVGVHRNHADKHVPAGCCPNLLNAYDYFHDKGGIDKGFALITALRAMELYYAGVVTNHAASHVPAGRIPNILSTVMEWFNGDKRILYIFEQRTMSKEAEENGEVACVESHFLDSGSFTLKTKAKEYAKQNGCSEWDFYRTQDFYAYCDAYAEFIKKYQIGIDYYANVDAIPNPKITWRNQKYLEEEHGLTPVPVVHYGTDLKWLRRYIDAGYTYIALGGLVGKTKQETTIHWIDRCFDMVCDNPQRLPSVDLHGFGITNYELLLRYPWKSVDSASWTKIAAFGGIIVPRKQQSRVGLYDFRHEPYILKVSNDSPDRMKTGKLHVFMVGKETRARIDGWLEQIGVPLGKCDKEGEVVEEGVINSYNMRQKANLLFFEELRKSLPDYPWPFKIIPRGHLGL